MIDPQVEVIRGYADEVATVAELWQAGKHDEARSKVPLDLGRLTNLLGTEEIIAQRIDRYRAAGITTLLAKLEGDYSEQLAALQRLPELTDVASDQQALGLRVVKAFGREEYRMLESGQVKL